MRPSLATSSYPPELRAKLEAAIAAVEALEPIPAGEVAVVARGGRRPVPLNLPGLVAIYGKKRTGKTTVADFLCRHYVGVVQVAFSAPMLDEVNAYFAGSGHVFTDANKAHPVYRRLLQMWAQARRFEDEDYWNARVLDKAREAAAAGARLVVASGLRQPDEKHVIESVGGEVWKVSRPDLEPEDPETDSHYNEIALDAMPDWEFARVFVNDGSKLSLCQQVAEALARPVKRPAK